MADQNPYAAKKAKIYGPEVLKELDADNVRAIVAVHGEGMLDYYDKHKNTDWTDEDTLRLLNTRLGRSVLNKIRLRNNVQKLKGYFRR
jgi:hypothetical protein